MPTINENVRAGRPVKGPFQQGSSNVDGGALPEKGLTLPAMSDSVASYFYFDCTVGVMLDSGIVVHNRLPQVNNLPDSLGSVALDDPTLDTITEMGVNLKCRDQYTDIMQRMGHARYWFRLWGQGLRLNHRIPIPSLKTIGGVPAIPYDRNPQWAFNRIFPGGNYSGVILWHAAWSLWYTTLVPPTSNTIPEVEPAAHITGAVAGKVLSNQAPFTRPDGDAVQSVPGTLTPKNPGIGPGTLAPKR